MNRCGRTLQVRETHQSVQSNVGNMIASVLHIPYESGVSITANL